MDDYTFDPRYIRAIVLGYTVDGLVRAIDAVRPCAFVVGFLERVTRIQLSVSESEFQNW